MVVTADYHYSCSLVYFVLVESNAVVASAILRERKKNQMLVFMRRSDRSREKKTFNIQLCWAEDLKAAFRVHYKPALYGQLVSNSFLETVPPFQFVE